MRLVSFDYFRGIAILFIVAGHSYGPWAIDSFGERVLANMISGGTALFVFISGFFFHHTFYENFNYGKFLRKKINYVFTPYLIFSAIGIIYYVSRSHQLPYAHKLGVENFESWIQHVEMFATYLWTGRIATGYWYIPFILIIFTASPLFIRYINLSTTSRTYLFLMLLVAAMFIQRPADNLSPLHSVIYFLPIYMLGIIFSLHREKVIEYIKGKSAIIGAVVLFLSVVQALLYEGYGNFHKEKIFSYSGLDVIIIQKIAMCFFFLALLQKYEHRNIPILKLLASSSFAIYFIHPWVLMKWSGRGGMEFLDFFPGMGVFLVTTPLVVTCSLLSAYLIKLLLQRNSRYVIGW